MNKNSKEVMKRSRLRNKFLNTKSDINRRACKEQRNICVTLIRKEKKNFNSKLNAWDVTESEDNAIAAALNISFINNVRNLKISMENDFDTNFL